MKRIALLFPILLAADDLGPGALGCYGKTPNLAAP